LPPRRIGRRAGRDRSLRALSGRYTAGQILVVSADGKLLRTIEVPSAAAPNLAFSPEEDMIYIAAVDDVSAAPWPGKVYAVPTR
jgi:sugar lactone lactonase YvrE